MGLWDRFRKWAKNKANAPARRLLGFVIFGTSWLLTRSVWITFATTAIWIAITR